MALPQADRAPATGRRPPVRAFVSAAWLGPALLAAFQVHMQSRLGNCPAGWRELLGEGGNWLLYALLTPLVLLIARRSPLARERAALRVAMHSLLLCAAWAAGGVLRPGSTLARTP